MKRTVIIQFVVLLFIFSCDEEVNRPVLQTLPVNQLNDQGVNYNGNISLIGSAPVMDYGFVWATHDNPLLLSDSIHYFRTKPVAGSFSIRISEELIPNSDYYVRSFIQTSEHIFYGNTVRFKSLGSAAPIITDFTPKSGASQDSFTITGDHFSENSSYDAVQIGPFGCGIISVSRTELVALTPLYYIAGSYPVFVRVNGKITKSTTNFTLEGPLVESISPASGPAGTLLTIVGSGFSSDPTANSVFIGAQKAVVADASTTQLHVIIPVDPQRGPKDVSVQRGPVTGASPSPFDLTGPTITSFSPASGIQGTQVVITGSGFSSVPEENLVSIGNYYGSAEVISASPQQLTVVVPIVYSAGNVPLIVTVKSIADVAVAPFTIEGPEITSITPNTQYGGREITLDGKNFDPNGNNSVFFLNEQASVIHYTTNSLTVQVPFSLTTDCPIAVQVGGIRYTTPFNFSILNPWQKQPAFPGGKRYGAVSFTLGSYAYVGMGIPGTGTDLKDLWRYDPSNSTWKKMADFPGSSRAFSYTFTINGKAYMGGGGHYGYSSYDLINHLYDLWEYNPDTDIWTEKHSSNPNAPVEATSATAIGSYGYLIIDNILYRYDPSSDQWTSSNSFPGRSNQANVAQTIGGKGYMGMGTMNNTFWEFDPAANSWSQLPDYPGYINYGETPLQFQINNKIYVGASQSMYEFDPTTSQWKRFPYFPEVIIYPTSFSINNIGYFATGLNGYSFDLFYSFDPNY